MHLEFLIRLKKNTSRDKKQLIFHLYLIAFHCENGGKMFLERLDENVFKIAENRINNDVVDGRCRYYYTVKAV